MWYADYGPYAFLDGYDEDFVGNTSDDSAQYAFGKQPETALWNLQKLSEELSVCLGIDGQLLDQVGAQVAQQYTNSSAHSESNSAVSGRQWARMYFENIVVCAG